MYKTYIYIPLNHFAFKVPSQTQYQENDLNSCDQVLNKSKEGET